MYKGKIIYLDKIIYFLFILEGCLNITINWIYVKKFVSYDVNCLITNKKGKSFDFPFQYSVKSY